MTACRWLCTTMVALVFWIVNTRSGCTCCHLHCCDIFKMRERNQCVQLKTNEIMNGNQGDHVTFVSTWRRSKQRLSFCRTFNHLFNTPMPRTVTDVPRSPDVTFLKQAGWYPWAVRLWICGRGPTMYSKCHACMPVRNVRTHAQHIQSPRPVENLKGVGQCS